MPERTPIAIYDLDRTVTFRATYTLFLLRTAFRLAPWRLAAAPLVALLMLLHVVGIVKRDRLKGLMWGFMLGPVSREDLTAAAEAFATHMIETNVRPGAWLQIARDRREGAMLVLATASHEIYAGPLARMLKFDAIVATQAEVRADGRIGPRLAGPNVYGRTKLVALERFLDERGLERAAVALTFYSDSSSDRHVLEWVDCPVAVNPPRKLWRLAASRGWPIVDWRRP